MSALPAKKKEAFAQAVAAGATFVEVRIAIFSHTKEMAAAWRRGGRG